MTGIVFFGSANYESVASFYAQRVGADVWLEQSACTILRYDNMLFGFCEADAAETDGVLTFVTDDRAGVDAFYDRFEGRARGEPTVNEEFDIYQFFADDPEGRTMEFQTFLHETDPVC
ncbi:MAG: VOC family protein [Halanaeroarchaeum sp.]